MQTNVTHPQPTEAVLTVIATTDELTSIKKHVLDHFQDKVKVPGFRAGHVPADVLEKHVDSNALSSEFLEHAMEQLYPQAVKAKQLRVVDRPKIELIKYVPFTELEFKATVPVIGNVKLAEYKKIKLAKPQVKLTAKDVDEVLESLRGQLSDKKDVDRAAKPDDTVYIDFKGVDAKGEPINGADGSDYPLTLGSNTFIPGFEDNVIGLKAGDEKTFTLTFPKDYGVKALASKKVTFTVNVTKVQEATKPKLDDAFAAKVGPFKSLADLKADIKTQVTAERQQQADRDYESELVRKISDKSTVEIPAILVDEQIQRIEQSERQNLVYRGQTWEEHLKEEGVTEAEHREQKRPEAESRVKASIVLAEIADAEGLDVEPEELEARINQYKAQYQDIKMREELDKPENRQDIASRILTEKTVAKLTEYAGTA
jgi:trigger factor